MASNQFGATTATPLDLTRFLPYRIHKLWAAISVARFLPMAGGGSLRLSEWRVLMIVAAFGPLTSAELADRAAMDTGSVARSVRALLDGGLLITRKPKSDRRKQMLGLTEAGAAAHDRIARMRQAFSDEALSCLSGEEQDMLFQLIDRLQRHVDDLAAGEEQWVD